MKYVVDEGQNKIGIACVQTFFTNCSAVSGNSCSNCNIRGNWSIARLDPSDIAFNVCAITTLGNC